MSDDTPPDRLSSDPASPYYDAALLERGVGVRLRRSVVNVSAQYASLLRSTPRFTDL